jgi:hypothetical protein
MREPYLGMREATAGTVSQKQNTFMLNNSWRQADPIQLAAIAATDETLRVVQEHTKEFMERIYPAYTDPY